MDNLYVNAVSINDVINPQITAIWEMLSIGVAVVDAKGICLFMNSIQRKIDGFTNFPVIGTHITDLYVPFEIDCIPTIECLQKGEPLHKKAYWYKTVSNYVFSSVTDFIPLFMDGKKDGVIAFTTWVDSTSFPEQIKGKNQVANRTISDTHYTFNNLIGHDRALEEAISNARKASRSHVSVMIWGESGTGKEIFAQAIHAESPRHNKPFVAINCAAIPESLLEGILFGTTMGSYTGAQDKPGLFEMAEGGTLLLDELNSMPLGLQAKLLRVIQEQKIRRIGSPVEKKIDVRVISLMNESPYVAIENQRLRTDLFYRLSVVGIAVPPLRERKSDIPLLVQAFIRRRGDDRKGVSVDDEVMHEFLGYDWPGNVRELEHLIEGSLILLGEERVITRETLPSYFDQALKRQASKHEKPQLEGPSGHHLEVPLEYRSIRRQDVIPLKAKLQAYERQCICQVLKVSGGNVAKAAHMLDLTAPGLRYRIKLLGIREEDF